MEALNGDGQPLTEDVSQQLQQMQKSASVISEYGKRERGRETEGRKNVRKRRKGNC